MWNRYLRLFPIVLFLYASVAWSQAGRPAYEAHAIQWKDLDGDDSRANLAYYEVLQYGSGSDKNVRTRFMFPADANDGIYGIDVSHHNGTVDWQAVSRGGARFAYIKATQAGQFRDKMFATNWREAARQNIRRGAYHFLTANISGQEQANAYLALLQSVGGLAENDLAPVLDLEWDFEVRNGKKVDRWSFLTPQQIAKIVLDWISAVKAATGRTPIIYTAGSWWKERMKGNVELQPYYQWLADYRASSIVNGAPLPVKNHTHRAWQFTDGGRFEGIVNKFDVNKLNGSDLAILMGR